MESVPRYAGTSRLTKTPQGPRRIWTNDEEQTLIACLHEMISSGWKADNGFKPGYLQALESTINARIPGSEIKVRHINSKLTVWKKQYYLLLAMLGTSGFGWNDDAKMIEVNDDVWAEYARANRDVRAMRMKSWRYYDDWCQLFGNDRATGDHAQGFADVVDDIILGENLKNSSNVEPYIPSFDFDSPCIDLTTDSVDWDGDRLKDKSNSTPDTSDGGPRKQKSKVKTFGLKIGGNEKTNKFKLTREKKVKTPESGKNETIVPLLTKFIEEAKSTFINLTPKMSTEEDTVDEKAMKVIAALEKVPGLSEENMNFLCYKIMDNPKHVSLFLRSSERNREIQARMMLEGKLT